MNKIVVASGGFDPIHRGHIKMFENASKLGSLVVVINTDKFLLKKKGFVFMPLKDRIEIIKSIKYVKKIVVSIDNDQSVSETLKKIKPDIFVNGGDRVSSNTLEVQTCKDNSIQMVFNIAPQLNSSSELIKRVFNELIK